MVDADGDGPDRAVAGSDGESDDVEALRRQVDEKYDFDDFGPADMAQMTLEEWEAAFDPDSWIVGPELLDRVESELKSAIARRDVFAKFERFQTDGETRLAAYSDEGYAIVHQDGSVEGRGTVLRDVKPIVALCSMEDFEVSPPPEEFDLPDPTDVPEGSGEFGNFMLQVIAGAQLLVGVGLIGAWMAQSAGLDLAPGLTTILVPALGLVFLLVGLFLFLVVANARLSDRFRAEEYRNRLRAVKAIEGERPAFLSGGDADAEEAGSLHAGEADSGPTAGPARDREGTADRVDDRDPDANAG
jgi:hypothetical protein